MVLAQSGNAIGAVTRSPIMNLRILFALGVLVSSLGLSGCYATYGRGYSHPGYARHVEVVRVHDGYWH